MAVFFILSKVLLPHHHTRDARIARPAKEEEEEEEEEDQQHRHIPYAPTPTRVL